MVEVEKGGLSTPATPLEMLRLYSSLYKLYYRHPSACEIKQTVFTPYDECEHFMDGCDVMLDQLYSYSPGLNALYAMSKGIVVVGGAEEEHYNLLGKDRLHPIINVYPEENDIYNKLDSLLANPNFSIIRRQH